MAWHEAQAGGDVAASVRARLVASASTVSGGAAASASGGGAGMCRHSTRSRMRLPRRIGEGWTGCAPTASTDGSVSKPARSVGGSRAGRRVRVCSTAPDAATYAAVHCSSAQTALHAAPVDRRAGIREEAVVLGEQRSEGAGSLEQGLAHEQVGLGLVGRPERPAPPGQHVVGGVLSGVGRQPKARAVGPAGRCDVGHLVGLEPEGVEAHDRVAGVGVLPHAPHLGPQLGRRAELAALGRPKQRLVGQPHIR